jgi:hypothetical protein
MASGSQAAVGRWLIAGATTDDATLFLMQWRAAPPIIWPPQPYDRAGVRR